jgi:hypothetical protein
MGSEMYCGLCLKVVGWNEWHSSHRTGECRVKAYVERELALRPRNTRSVLVTLSYFRPRDEKGKKGKEVI